jgi:hypothetical protein
VAGGYLVVARSDAHSELSNQHNVFDTRIPVKQGDLIGVEGDTTNLAAAKNTGNAGDVFLGTTSAVAGTGATILTGSLGTYTGYLLDISASVEPDADQDGYGDETQDACPADASKFVGPCTPPPGPVLTVGGAKTQKIKTSFTLSLKSNVLSSVTVATSVTSTKKGSKPIQLANQIVATHSLSTTPVTIKLTSKAKAALKSSKKLLATITLTAVDSAGNSSSTVQNLTLKSKN